MSIDKAKRSAAMQLLGRYSLEIFVAHTIISAAVRIALQKLTDVTSPALYLLLGTATGLVIPILLAVACQRIGLKCRTSCSQACDPIFRSRTIVGAKQVARPAITG